MIRRWLSVGLWLLPALASAHPLAPALLQLQQTAAEDYQVTWRTSVSRVQGTDVEPQLPSQCATTQAPTITLEDGEALVTRWAVRCAAPGLSGGRIVVKGLENAGVNVIFRLERQDGAASEMLLDASQTALTVPPASAPPPVFSGYLKMGVTHLLSGYDHLLFVTGLLLLVRRLRPLLITVTAFTIGHSITLALATLNLIKVNSALAEFGIALSILLVANEIARGAGHRSLLSRRPWLMAGGFGLLHGLGFAGALAEVGLPQHEIPLALLAFNLGIELGQLLVVAAALSLALLWRRLPLATPRHSAALRYGAAYGIGALAALWCLERATTLWA